MRAVRVRLGLRQVDVARRAGVAESVVRRVEHGRLLDVSLRALLAITEALEIRLDLTAWWHGGDLDRMLNAKHAALAESVTAFLLAQPGWQVRPEVSFNLDRERGIVDLVAWHAATSTVLLIELKTDIVDVGELLGTFDRKRRLAGRIAASLGWRPQQAGCAVIVREGRTNRRRVEQHALTLRASLPDDIRRFRSWLLAPSGRMAALAFLPDHRSLAPGQSSANVRRVRVRATGDAGSDVPRR